MTTGVRSYVARILAVAGMVGMTTIYVWSKVQAGSVTRHIDAANHQRSRFEEDRSKLAAAVERAKLPGALRQRAVRDLHMVVPETPTQVVIE